MTPQTRSLQPQHPSPPPTPQAHAQDASAARHATPQVGAWSELDPAHPTAAAPGDSYDLLADLFLGSPKPDVPPAAHPATTTPTPGSTAPTPPTETAVLRTPPVPGSMEMLLTSHLGSAAHPWCRQYARHIAATTSALVALARWRGHELTIEVFGGSVPSWPATPAQIFATLAAHQAITLLRADDLGPWTAADVTLITAVDESAILGAYRTLKAAHADRRSTDPRPTRLLAVGCSPAEAASALSRLERTARSLAGLTLTRAGSIPAIDANPTLIGTIVYHGPSIPPTEATAALSRTSQTKHRLPPITTPDPQPQPAQSPVAASPDPSSELPTATAARRIGQAPSTPRSATRAIPGLTPIGPLCPHTPAVDFACDDLGTLHLVALVPDAEHIHQTLGQIAIARAWAADSLPLISRLAELEAASLDPAAPIVAHLVARDPRALRRVPDAAARLHLLTTDHTPAIELN